MPHSAPSPSSQDFRITESTSYSETTETAMNNSVAKLAGILPVNSLILESISFLFVGAATMDTLKELVERRRKDITRLGTMMKCSFLVIIVNGE